MTNPSIVLLGGTPYAHGAVRYFDVFTRTVRKHAIAVEHSELRFALVGPECDTGGAVRAALEQLPDVARPRTLFHL